MKKNRKTFVLMETVLAVLVILVSFLMLRERNGKDLNKISVIVQNSDSNRWSSFRYGLKMAAEDTKVELSIVSTGTTLTLQEQESLVMMELDNGADGFLLQPIGEEGEEKMLQELKKEVPVMLVESSLNKEDSKTELPSTRPDNYELGKALGEELKKDYTGGMEGKKIGFVFWDESSKVSQERKNGFLEVVGEAEPQILWSVSLEKEGNGSLQAQPWVDLVVAFDDYSLKTAGKDSADRNLHGALVYGIGTSTETVYYLDTGAVECLAVPDEFTAGYQSLTEVVKEIQDAFYEMTGSEVSHTILRRQSLFSEENQKLLYTMSQ